MLELINVKKTYVTKAGDTIALNNISLNFEEKGMVFITGKSGSGKTTLLNVIGGLDDIDSGEIVVDGRKLSTLTMKEYDSYRNTFVGFVFQEYNLLNEFSVEKNIEIANELQGKATDKKEYNELLEKVEISDLGKRKPNQLSGGQKQRVAIARALLKNPRIIMADEPTGALDTATGISVLETLKKLSKEKLVIVVSHDNELAETYADRIIRISDGVVESDLTLTKKEIKDNVVSKDGKTIVKSGSKLNEDETKKLVDAIANEDEIEITKSIYVNEKENTKPIKVERNKKPIEFINSKMKLKSSTYLGLKSLTVKPFRLIITILLSVIAFSVFGVFDTVANYSRAKVTSRLIDDYSAITLASEQVNEYSGDVTNNTIGDSFISSLNKDTGYNFRGVYPLNSSLNANHFSPAMIEELKITSVSVGVKYYTKSLIGAVEFKKEEIVGTTIDPTGFNLQIIQGRYPEKVEEGTLPEIALSSYVIDSIKHFSQSLNEYVDYVGSTIILNEREYTIVGIIDCGAIPEKFTPLKNSFTNKYDSVLYNDFSTFIHSGLYLNAFVCDGFIQDDITKSKKQPIYYSNSRYDISGMDNIIFGRIENRFFHQKDFAPSNVLFFDGEVQRNTIELGENGVIINVKDFFDFYDAEIFLLNNENKIDLEIAINTIKGESSGIKEKLVAFNKVKTILNEKLNKNIIVIKTDGIDKQYKMEVTCKGIYFDVSDTSYYASRYNSFIVNDEFFKTFDIGDTQGHYSKAVSITNIKGANNKKLASYFDNKVGNTYNWYGNSILSSLTDYEETIEEFIDLFLYISIALALFSAFMLYNYISVSISSKKQTIGVLRALGSNGRDVFRMFISESLIISLISALISVIVTFFACNIINSYIKEVIMISADFAIFGLRQVIITFAVSISVAIVSSILPIIKICKEKPVKLIREP